jgi:MinD superfamily P-loop ATPase
MEIAIISGKGGTGKSSVSAAFATTGEKLVLADCDVDAANLYLLFQPVHEHVEKFTGSYKAEVDEKKCTGCGVCTNFCRFGAIRLEGDVAQVSGLSCEGCFICQKVCPEDAIFIVKNDSSRLFSGSYRNGRMVYGRLAPGEENSGKLVNLVRERARLEKKRNGYDHIILDGPPGIGCPVISTITGVNKVLIVTEPTVSGLADLARVAEVARGIGIRPLVLINKHDLNGELTEKLSDWCERKGLKIIGLLPFNQEVTTAMCQRKSIVEWDPKNPVSKKLASVWEELLIEDNV